MFFDFFAVVLMDFAFYVTSACCVVAMRLSIELGDQGSSSGRTSTQGHKITEDKVPPLRQHQ